MGQKVHPYGFRIGYNRTWHSRWYAEKDYLKFLHDDLKLRDELKRDLANAAVSEVEIERGNKLKINIMTARPGVIIGKKGASVDQLRDRLQQRLGKDIHVNIVEIQRPETDAQLGAQGIKIRCGGRLNGAEIARSEWYQEGRLPLHTLKADIDYGFAEARTTYGKIGVKCWIYKGDLHRAKSRRKVA